MASINTRPTKRAKITRELPDVLFRHILSYIVSPGKTVHKEKMQAVFKDITTLNLYNPIVGLQYNAKYYDWSYEDADQLNQPLAVVNSALGGFIDEGHEHYQFDVRFQTTQEIWRTMDYTHGLRKEESVVRNYGIHPLYDKHDPESYHPATVKYMLST